MGKLSSKILKPVVKSFNVLLDKDEKLKKINVVGKSNVDIQAMIVANIETLAAEDRVNDIPDDVLEFYNTHCAAEEDEGTDEKDEKPKEEKKEEKKKAPKKTVPRDAFGCQESSGAATMNALMVEGTTLDDMTEATGSNKSRVSSHIYSLKKKGFYVTVEGSVYTLTTEEPPEKPEKEKKEKKVDKKEDKKEEKTDKETDKKTDKKKDKKGKSNKSKKSKK